MKFNKNILLIGLLITIHILFNYYYIVKNSAPIPWDQANHTRIAFLLKECVLNTPTECLTISYYYPIFAHTIVAITFILLGNSIMLAQLSGTLFFSLLILGIYLYIQTLSKNKTEALITTIIFSTLPLIYHSSRFFWLEIPLLMNTIFSMYFLIRSEGYTKKPQTALAFLFTGLAMMTKWYGVLYLILPYIYELKKAKNSFEKKNTIILNIILGVLILAVVTIPWYYANLNKLIETATYYSQADASQPKILLSIDSLTWYFKSALQNQLGFIPFLVSIVSLIYFIKNYKDKTKKPLIILQIIFIYIVFTLLGNKDMRFTLMIPLYLVYTISYFLVTIKNKGIKYITTTILGAYLVISLLIFTFSWPLKENFKISFNTPFLGWIDIVNWGQYPVERPNNTYYPIKEVIEDIKTLDKKGPNKILIVFDYPHLNSTNLITQQLIETNTSKNNTHIESIFLPEGLKNDKEVKEYINNFDYALVSEYETAIGYFRFKESLDKIQNHIINNNYKVIKTYELPIEDIEKYLSLYNDPNTSDTKRTYCKETKQCNKLILYAIESNK